MDYWWLVDHPRRGNRKSVKILLSPNYPNAKHRLKHSSPASNIRVAGH
jgi:hypothetical protein